LRISAADGCALCLVIQSPEPQPAARGSSHAVAFKQAVILLKLVARGLESMLEAEELRWSLDQARRLQQAVLARDDRLRQALKTRLPELAGEPQFPEMSSQAARLVHQVRDFLQHNYQRPLLGLGEAAASVHRSSSYLSTLFARETGVSLHSYLQELRLTKARELLRDPRLSVAEVAHASGYASAGWFRHSFKHHVGLSPSDWRRSHHRH
jgi:AraC-like DNA-binding protein